MTYGDGSRDPKTWNTSCEGFPPLTTLDIIAHELTHGVTEYSAGLIYQVGVLDIRSAGPSCKEASTHVPNSSNGWLPGHPLPVALQRVGRKRM
jgi:hypothetical protein